MANKNFTQKFFTLHNYPVLLDCNFIVDSANTNGLGQRSLKGPGINQVFMNTSATPLLGNPNPAAGYAIVMFDANYNRCFGMNGGFVAPTTGSAISSGLTVGLPYVIASLGSSTLAQFQAAGLPVGMTPAVGMPFIAAATSIAGGATVLASASSQIDSIELIGNSNLSIISASAATPRNAALGQGPYVILKFLKSGVLQAPVDESLCQLSFYFSNSSVTTAGE